MIQSYLRLCLLLGIIILICGCGSGPKLVQVTGTITLDGKPLENASVHFTFSDQPRPAAGRTDASGKYVLSYSNRPGAPLGSCKVTISKQGRVAGEDRNQELIPSRYNSNTQLQFEITKKGPNEFSLDLDSTPDEADSKNLSQPSAVNDGNEPLSAPEDDEENQ